MSALTQKAVPQPGVASTEHAAAPGTVPAREPLATTTNGPAATHEADPKVVKQAEKEHKKCVLLSPPPLHQLECHQRATTHSRYRLEKTLRKEEKREESEVKHVTKATQKQAKDEQKAAKVRPSPCSTTRVALSGRRRSLRVR